MEEQPFVVEVAAPPVVQTPPGATRVELPQALQLAQNKWQSGDEAAARDICNQVLAQMPNQPDFRNLLAKLDHNKHIEAAKARFPGTQYLDWLKWFHRTLKPATYLEIGVESGQSLQFALPPTHAVGVDPEIKIVHPQESWVKLFKKPSDDFFAQHDLREVFGSENLDLVFIDGLHTFDQALKDFMNAERYAHAGTVAVFHDIFPVVPVTAERDRQSIFWLGDTWKAIMILREQRPDLTVFTIPAYPSGLTVVAGMDPESRVLAKSFDSMVEKWMAIDLEPMMGEIDQRLNVVDNDFVTVSRLLGR